VLEGGEAVGDPFVVLHGAEVDAVVDLAEEVVGEDEEPGRHLHHLKKREGAGTKWGYGESAIVVGLRGS